MMKVSIFCRFHIFITLDVEQADEVYALIMVKS